MRWKSCILLLLIFSGCNKQPEETTTSGKLHIFVCEPIAPPIIDGIGEFLKLYRDNGAQISFSVNSTDEVIKHFINDSGKIAIIPRQLSQAEKEQAKKISGEVNELVVAYDGIAVIVNSKNKTKEITTTDIKKILIGKTTKWEQITNKNSIKGSIKVYCQDSPDITEYLTHRLLGKEKIEINAIKTSSSLNTIQLVEKEPTAIGFVSTAWLDSAKANIKVLNVGRIKEDTDTTFLSTIEVVGKFFSPDPAYIYLNYYPLKRAIYMYTYSKVNLAMGFGTFMATADGQKLFLKRGLLPGTQKIRIKSQ